MILTYTERRNGGLLDTRPELGHDCLLLKTVTPEEVIRPIRGQVTRLLFPERDAHYYAVRARGTYEWTVSRQVVHVRPVLKVGATQCSWEIEVPGLLSMELASIRFDIHPEHVLFLTTPKAAETGPPVEVPTYWDHLDD